MTTRWLIIMLGGWVVVSGLTSLLLSRFFEVDPVVSTIVAVITATMVMERVMRRLG